jgi:hypothetical protein
MQLFVNRDKLNRLVLICIDDNLNRCTGIISKKVERNINLTVVFKMLISEKNINNIYMEKMAGLGFKNIKYTINNKGE